MLFTSFTALLALTGLTNAASIKNTKRAGSAQTLYAYGTGSNGAPVFYADGLAYIGTSGLSSNATTQTNITFDTTGTTWPIAANSSTVSFNETQYMYLIPTNGSFQQVGFAANSSIPEGASIDGFNFFGSTVAFAVSDSDYEITFWGVNTSTTDVYALYWNADGSATEGAMPVVLKNKSPTIPNRD